MTNCTIAGLSGWNSFAHGGKNSHVGFTVYYSIYCYKILCKNCRHSFIHHLPFYIPKTQYHLLAFVTSSIQTFSCSNFPHHHLSVLNYSCKFVIQQQLQRDKIVVGMDIKTSLNAIVSETIFKLITDFPRVYSSAFIVAHLNYVSLEGFLKRVPFCRRGVGVEAHSPFGRFRSFLPQICFFSCSKRIKRYVNNQLNNQSTGSER